MEHDHQLVWGDGIAIGFDMDDDLIVIIEMPCGCCAVAVPLQPEQATALAKELTLAAAAKRTGGAAGSRA